MDGIAPKNFANRLAVVAAETEVLLESLLDSEPGAGEIARPQRLLAAMRHAMLAGGKRLRPFLLVGAAAPSSGPRANGRSSRAPDSNVCTAIRWCMTICRRWTTT